MRHSHSILFTVFGVLLGCVVTWIILDADIESPLMASALRGFGAAGVALICGAAIAVLGLSALARRAFSGAKATLEAVIDQAEAGVQRIGANDRAAAAAHFAAATREAAAWYAVSAARRASLAALLGLVAAFGGLVGAALLFRQIALLKEQNEKLDRQTSLLSAQNGKIDLQIVTAEAQRRADLTTELFSIMKDVEAYSKSEAAARKPMPASAHRQLLVLDRGLKARIKSFAAAATPYHVVAIKKLADGFDFSVPSRASSPQRGQLLLGLAEFDVDVKDLSATFTAADLRGHSLQNAFLKSINLDLSALYGANLINADLEAADLSGARLDEADLTSADLRNADLGGATFEHADLSGAIVDGANLKRADLALAQLAQSDGGEVGRPARISMLIRGLNRAASLEAVIWPEGWRLIERTSAGWTIDTPWGDYERLIGEIEKQGFAVSQSGSGRRSSD